MPNLRKYYEETNKNDGYDLGSYFDDDIIAECDHFKYTSSAALINSNNT